MNTTVTTDVSPMPGLSVITGAPAALDAALAAEIRAHKDGDPLAPVTVLAGGTLLRPFLRARLATLLGGHINVRVVTPAELALRLGEPALIAAGRSPITPLADRALAQELARGAESYFAPVRDTPGFANALHRLFGELRAASIGPAQLVAAAAGMKQRELAELYRGYLESRAPFYDAGDAMAAPDPGRLDDRAVLLYGVWEVAPRLRALIEVAAERVPVTVLLPLTGTVADDAHAELRDWLASRGADIRHIDSAPARSALETLRQQLFADVPAPAAPDDTVALLSAPDPAREAREAVRACLGWAADGIRFHEMAIVYRHGAEYRGLIDQALREAAIPVYLHEGTPLSERPLGRQAFALLDLFDSNLPRAQVMQFLADARLPEDVGALRRRLRADLGRALAPRGHRGGRGAMAGAARAAAHRACRSCAKPRRTRPSGFCVGSRRSIGSPRSSPTSPTPSSGDRGRRPGRRSSTISPACSRPTSRTRRGSIGALATLADLDALGEPVSAERFLDVVRAAIEGLRVSDVSDERQGAFARRGVNVLDVNSTAAPPLPGRGDRRARRALVPAAATPGPTAARRRARSSCARARSWSCRCGPAAPTPRRCSSRSRSAAAEERLQLSFARAESAGGRGQLPSRFFRDAARALTGEPVRAARVDELPAWLYRRVSARAHRRRATRAARSACRNTSARCSRRQPRLGAALLARSSPDGRACAGRAARALALDAS